MKAFEGKRKFLVALSDESRCKVIVEQIKKHVSASTIYTAKDGIEALNKAQNDLPHVIIAERELSKISGIEFVTSLFGSIKGAPLAVIFISEIPDTEHFVDEVVLGKVQFFQNLEDEVALTKALAKALNFVSHGGTAEFFLKFLAPGDLLIKEGDRGDSVYVVKKGCLQAYSEKSGQAVILGNIREGEFVGEMAYINGDLRSASVVAKNDCELIEIPIEHLDHLLFQKPAWQKALFKTLSQRVKLANELKAAVNQPR